MVDTRLLREQKNHGTRDGRRHGPRMRVDEKEDVWGGGHSSEGVQTTERLTDGTQTGRSRRQEAGGSHRADHVTDATTRACEKPRNLELGGREVRGGEMRM